MANTYDVLIVGARVAGAITAALLGDAGYRVLLVDRGRFASPTVSAHYFHGTGLINVLKRLDILDEVLASGAPPLHWEYHYPDGNTDAQRIPVCGAGDIGYTLSVRREVLDALLVKRAVRSGTVDLADSTWMRSLMWDNQRVSGARLVTNRVEYEVHSRFVIGADGRNSVVARDAQAAYEQREEGIRGMYYAYVPQPTPPIADGAIGAEFSSRGDERAYLFPGSHGEACVALSVNQSTFAWMRSDIQHNFWKQLDQHRGIATRLPPDRAVPSVQGCGPIANYVRTPFGPGWALVGDAGMHQDPWSGQGMNMAGVHATFLVDALLQTLGGERPEAEALATYHQRRNNHGLKVYQRTVALARDLSQA